MGLIDAILAVPSQNVKYPAIVYMHGGAVRERGIPVYKPNGDFLFVINGKIKDMHSMNFVALAHIRKTDPDYCNGDEAVKQGISIARLSAS